MINNKYSTFALALILVLFGCGREETNSKRSNQTDADPIQGENLSEYESGIFEPEPPVDTRENNDSTLQSETDAEEVVVDPTPTPAPSPTPTPDPALPTVESANAKISELENTCREQKLRIEAMKQIISTEENDMRQDWNNLKSQYQRALKEAEDSAFVTKYKKVKRRDMYGREVWVSVPYEQKQMGTQAKITNIKNQFETAKLALTGRNTELENKRNILAQTEAQLIQFNAQIEHIQNWIHTHQNEAP